MEVEWKRLRDLGCWDESRVAEWRDVARSATSTNHVGRVFGVCVEKNVDLPADNPNRKYKGRVVFQGNQVLDQNWDVAMFQELSSCPASLEAAKTADVYGLSPGNCLQQADAEQAYTQSKLRGTPTWVRLPRDQWPTAWVEKGYKDPVCPLVLALYGHPDSGGFWEQHCETHLKSQGFEPVPEWIYCFWHRKLRYYLLSTSTTSSLPVPPNPCRLAGNSFRVVSR